MGRILRFLVSALAIFNRGTAFDASDNRKVVVDAAGNLEMDSIGADLLPDLKAEARNFYADYFKQEEAKYDSEMAVDLKIMADWLFAGRDLSRVKKGKKALEMINHAIVLNPSGTWFYFDRGRYRNYLGDFAGAKEDFAYSLEVENDPIMKSRTHLEIARIYRSEGKYEESLAEYQKIIELKVEEDSSFLNAPREIKELEIKLQDKKDLEDLKDFLAAGSKLVILLTLALCAGIYIQPLIAENDVRVRGGDHPEECPPKDDAESMVRFSARTSLEIIIQYQSLTEEEKSAFQIIDSEKLVVVFGELSQLTKAERDLTLAQRSVDVILEEKKADLSEEQIEAVKDILKTALEISDDDLIKRNQSLNYIVRDAISEADFQRRCILSPEDFKKFFKVFQDAIAASLQKTTQEVHKDVESHIVCQELLEELVSILESEGRVDQKPTGTTEGRVTASGLVKNVKEKS